MTRALGFKGRDTGSMIRLLVVFIGAVVVSGLLSPISLSPGGINLALVSFATEVALVTLGQALVIITGGIDLSVAGIVSVTGVTVGALAHQGLPTIALILIGLAVGCTCGLINGLIVAYVGAPPIMVTLATGILFGGFALGVTQGVAYSVFPAAFLRLGQGGDGMPIQVLVAVAASAVIIIMAGATRYGTWIYAVGANHRAARLSGVPVEATKVGVYLASGVLASIAGLIMTSRLNSSISDMGAGLELASITAAVLGGISVFGGRGTLFGAILGVLTISVLQNAMTLAGIDSGTRSMVIAVLLITVLLSSRITVGSLVSHFSSRGGGEGKRPIASDGDIQQAAL